MPKLLLIQLVQEILVNWIQFESLKFRQLRSKKMQRFTPAKYTERGYIQRKLTFWRNMALTIGGVEIIARIYLMFLFFSISEIEQQIIPRAAYAIILLGRESKISFHIKIKRTT